MFLSFVLRASKPKAKVIMVTLRSIVSGHERIGVRERLGDKLELLRYDPYIKALSIYTEKKKVRSVRENIHFDRESNPFEVKPKPYKNFVNASDY